jgi:signal transduction histidine kinase
MLDVAPDAMLAVDVTTAAVHLSNAHADALFGRARGELVGLSADELLPGWRRECSEAAGACMSEHWIRRADGGEVPVTLWCSPLPSCDGVVGITIRDASERHTVLEASERMRDELLATVSHELRTPLTSILGYTEILVEMGEERLGTHASQLLDVVRRNACRQLKLVEDLLTLALLGSSSLEVDPEPTDLGLVARAVVADLAGPAAEAGIVLDPTGLDSLWVLGDPQRLEHVLGNLVGNAVKFTPPGGRVEVRLLTEGGHGLVEVEDQGMGVAPEVVPRVFDRLYRAPDVVDAHLPGAGLGLPVAKGIVDAHRGEISVESHPGQGTTVRVRLPLVSAELAV